MGRNFCHFQIITTLCEASNHWVFIVKLWSWKRPQRSSNQLGFCAGSAKVWLREGGGALFEDLQGRKMYPFHEEAYYTSTGMTKWVLLGRSSLSECWGKWPGHFLLWLSNNYIGRQYQVEGPSFTYYSVVTMCWLASATPPSHRNWQIGKRPLVALQTS